MHALSAIVSGLLVTSGAVVSFLQEEDLGIPLHFGNQAPAGDGNVTEAGNETESGNETEAGNGTQPADNATADNATAPAQNATADNQTAGNETEAECEDEADCHFTLYDSGSVLLAGEGDWSWEVTDSMRYVQVYLRVSSFGAGLTDSVDATLRDGRGRVVGELHRDGAFGDDAYLEVNLDRLEEDAYSGQWRLEMELDALHGSYDLWVEASCKELEPYWHW